MIPFGNFPKILVLNFFPHMLLQLIPALRTGRMRETERELKINNIRHFSHSQLKMQYNSAYRLPFVNTSIVVVAFAQHQCKLLPLLLFEGSADIRFTEHGSVSFDEREQNVFLDYGQ